MALQSTSTILANLAPTQFQAGPKDTVAVADVYGLNSSTINSNATINTNVGRFTPTAAGVINNLLAGSTGILGSLTALTSLGSLSATVASITNSGTVARISASIGLPVGSLSAGLQSALGSAVNLNLGNYNTALVSVGDSTYSVDADDVSMVAGSTGIINLANQVAGTTLATAVDVGAATTAASAITSQLISLGLSAVVGSFIASQTQPTLVNNGTTNQTVGQTALSQNVMTAIRNSDLTTLQLCIDQLGIGGVLSQVPNAALLLLQNYKIPKGTAASGYAACWTALQGFLTQLAPTWETSQRGGTTVDSLLYFQAASQDAITVMKASDDAVILIGATIASSFKAEDTLTTLEQMYPYMLKL